jgi:hypothetical protein
MSKTIHEIKEMLEYARIRRDEYAKAFIKGGPGKADRLVELLRLEKWRIQDLERQLREWTT